MNSVFHPSVDVRADIAAINQGDATRQGEDWLVNGRRYRIEETGRAYPVDGEGVYQLRRGAYIALAAYNTYGQSERTRRYLDGNNVAQDERALGWRVHLIGVEYGRDAG